MRNFSRSQYEEGSCTHYLTKKGKEEKGPLLYHLFPYRDPAQVPEGFLLPFNRDDHSLKNEGSFPPYMERLNDLSEFVYFVGNKQSLNPMPVQGLAPNLWPIINIYCVNNE